MTQLSWQHGASGAEYRVPVFTVEMRSVQTSSTAPTWSDWQRSPTWAPVRLRWGTNGELSTLELRKALGVNVGGQTMDPAGLPYLVAGDKVRLIEWLEGNGPYRGASRVWFEGIVGQDEFLIQSEPDVEAVTAVAYGVELLVGQKVVMGQWCAKPEYDKYEIDNSAVPGDRIRANTFQSDLPAVFNPAGEPNASWQTWSLCTGGGSGKVFVAPKRWAGAARPTHWTALAALTSVLDYYDAAMYVLMDDAIANVLGAAVLSEVSVDGLDLLQAMRAILLPLGFGFYFELAPHHSDTEQQMHWLRVFPLRPAANQGETFTPVLADREAGNAIGSAAGVQATVQRLHFIRDGHNIRNDITIKGDVERKQVTLEFLPVSDASQRDLQPFWNTTADSLDTYDRSNVLDDYNFANQALRTQWAARYEPWRHSEGSSRNAYHAFRSFAWNEDGALYNVIDTIPDLSALLGANYQLRPRPVHQSITYESTDATATGKLHTAKVFLGVYGDTNSWIDITKAVSIWPDRAGFTITVPQLLEWWPYEGEYGKGDGAADLDSQYAQYSYLTLLHNAIRNDGDAMLSLRLVGCVETDSATTGEAARILDSAWPWEAQRMFRMPHRFATRSVYGTNHHGTSLSTDTRDDSSDAKDYAKQLRDALEDATGHGSLMLRGLQRGIRPGMRVPYTSPDHGGRNVSLLLSAREGEDRSQYAPVVSGVTWQFTEGAYKTEVLLDTGMLRIVR